MIPKAYQIISNKIKKYAIQRQEPTSNLKIDQSTAKSVDVASNAKSPLLSRDCVRTVLNSAQSEVSKTVLKIKDR